MENEILYVFLIKKRHTSSFRKRSPATFAMKTDVINETLVFFLCPSPFVGVSLFTAR